MCGAKEEERTDLSAESESQPTNSLYLILFTSRINILSTKQHDRNIDYISILAEIKT
jgi:hypothetical protein